MSKLRKMLPSICYKAFIGQCMWKSKLTFVKLKGQNWTQNQGGKRQFPSCNIFSTETQWPSSVQRSDFVCVGLWCERPKRQIMIQSLFLYQM